MQIRLQRRGAEALRKPGEERSELRSKLIMKDLAGLDLSAPCGYRVDSATDVDAGS